MNLYRQSSDPAASDDHGRDRTGAALLISLALLGLLPFAGALEAGEPIQGAAAVGFSLTLLAVVLLLSEVLRSARPERRPARADLSDPRRWS